ncbi:corrinoid protein [Tepidibacter aestuarii]|uniref:corrinoid protein n=1 Tax=Tepidibacter aestuarii TaxID=2925782 RepID=UPI0020C13B3D|nr:corrinoid protein [Tepidibacter aestuarii]CAH2211995.1 Cobalamin-binding protein, vitamin B12 binding protein [Tepidibacter aestuarii]
MSISKIYDAVLEFDEELVVESVEEEISKGTDITSVLNDGLISAMDEVGRLFSEGEFFVPEMLMAAHSMKAGLDVLKPHMSADDNASKGTIVIGSVKGDMHDIGKNLVAMMMEGAGFKVVDIGIDADTETFLNAAKEHGADVVCMSALLTTTMPAMAEVINKIKEEKLEYKTMVGGAPVTQKFADQIGASGYSEDAAEAVELARELVK